MKNKIKRGVEPMGLLTLSATAYLREPSPKDDEYDITPAASRHQLLKTRARIIAEACRKVQISRTPLIVSSSIAIIAILIGRFCDNDFVDGASCSSLNKFRHSATGDG